jgi:hypothetical protein
MGTRPGVGRAALRIALVLGVIGVTPACGGGASDLVAADGGAGSREDASHVDGSRQVDAATDGRPSLRDARSPRDAAASGDATDVDAAPPLDTCTGSPGDAGTSCYSISCTAGGVHTLQANRDRLVADLARRKCTDSCTLWAALNEAERYVFLMDTAYLGATTSRLYPPSYNNLETALDHAVAMYSVNGPKAGQGTDSSGRGGNDYNRIYLGFDDFAKCVMRNFTLANPMKTPDYNEWVKSDDVAGPHPPFTQREMIYWYKAIYDLQSNGPQFHHWHQDSDFTQSGIDVRLGVCGNTDRSLTELTIAFDFYHSSDPLGDYSGQGGYGWQIVDQYVGLNPDWTYMPTSCPVTAPVNTDPYGGGTFEGMGPVQADGGACTDPVLGDAGCL